MCINLASLIITFLRGKQYPDNFVSFQVQTKDWASQIQTWKTTLLSKTTQYWTYTEQVLFSNVKTWQK